MSSRSPAIRADSAILLRDARSGPRTSIDALPARPSVIPRGLPGPMSLLFEQLDYRATPIGALSLRQRHDIALGIAVFEIMIGDHYPMSSLFTASEIALARLVLGALPGGSLDAEPVTFTNPLQEHPFAQAVYLARTASGSSPGP